MATALMNVQDSIHQYIDVATAVLDVRLDVVDTELVRVAGTRDFDADIGKQVRFGRIFRQILETGAPFFLKDPTVFERCKNCPRLKVCGSWARIYVPVIADGQIIGALSVSPGNEQQNDVMLSETSRYENYAQSLADLIALKVKEYQSESLQRYNLELQQKLMNMINEGVMILDSKRHILYANERCEYMIGCNMRQIAYLEKHNMFTIRQENDGGRDKTRYRIKIRENTVFLEGDTYMISSADEREFNVVFIFSEMKSDGQHSLEQETGDETLSSLTGKSEVFVRMIDACKQAAYNEGPVLLVGESGTGKEVIAKAIHNEGLYRGGTFLVEDDSAESRRLWDELQGGIDQITIRERLFRSTLYIDEVIRLDWDKQHKLWQIINNSKQMHVSVICSTKHDLKKQMEQGNIDPDLYYALELYTIQIPPLRARGDDIVLLTNECLYAANRVTGKHIAFSKSLRRLMRRYSWNGNTRELRDFISYIVRQADYEEGVASEDNIPSFLLRKLQHEASEAYHLAASEKQTIIRALNDLEPRGYTKQQIAKELGIGSATLYRKIRSYGIDTHIVYD